MGRKSNRKDAESTEFEINKEKVAVDVAILANLVAMVSQLLGTFSLFIQAESIREEEEEAANSSAKSGSNDAISPERFRKLEKQVQYLSKEIERLRG